MTGSRLVQRSKPAPATGIVHLGIGAFFRAHAAVYLSEAAEQGASNWGVTGVSMTSPRVRDLLSSQDFAYTAVETSDDGLSPRKVEVVSNVLVAPEDPAAVIAAIASEDVKIVSLTVTEKGYCRGTGQDALDRDHPDIKHDLESALPRSAPGLIVRALQNRHARGMRPFTVLSLDNLPANGRLTRQIILDFATEVDPELANWIKEDCRFPSTMVDRIVPATTPEMIARLERETGTLDPAAVFHEPFRQWVIEDSFVDEERPDLGAVGATLVDDVAPFEHMKLRMLNGSHSALAYIGRLAGHRTVAEAIADPAISDFITRMWKDEVIPSISPPPDTNLTHYATQLRARYQNPEIRHLLTQIAMDGSQKLRQRILDPLFENRAAGRPFRCLLTVVGAWILFLRERARTGQIDDPLADTLTAAIGQSDNTNALAASVLAIEQVFGGYPAVEVRAGLEDMLRSFDGRPISAVLERTRT